MYFTWTHGRKCKLCTTYVIFISQWCYGFVCVHAWLIGPIFQMNVKWHLLIIMTSILYCLMSFQQFRSYKDIFQLITFLLLFCRVTWKAGIGATKLTCRKTPNKILYSRTSMAQTELGPWKLVLAKGISSHPGWIMLKITSRDMMIIVLASPGPEVIKLFSCSTPLSTKFILLISVKMPTIVGILTFISMVNTTYERLKAINFFVCWYFSFYEQLKFRAQLSWAWKKFNSLGARWMSHRSSSHEVLL